MGNGEGCVNLYRMHTRDEHGIKSHPAYRLCKEREGFMLKHWRCVGKDHPDCPGFQPTPDTKAEGGE